MKKSRAHNAATRDDLLKMFSKIDATLEKQGQHLRVTALGGVSVIILGIRERSTLDIDIANVDDAVPFREFCAAMGVQVDIVTVSSTVDFAHAPKVSLYKGNALRIDSISPEELLKLKLERFRKQDPEDVYAIIEKTALTYEKFKSNVREMLPYFIGNPRELLLSALIVVQRMYPAEEGNFKTFLQSMDQMPR